MELRDYQLDVIHNTYAAWNSGHQNVGAQLATGGGKTVLFSKIVADHPGAAIVIAHRVELVSQISLTLAKYGIRHNLIAQKSAIREICTLHVNELGKAFYSPYSKIYVAGVDTLIRLPLDTPWFKQITLVVQDEAHHVLKKNKWGKAASLFPNAKGFYPSATPLRADGCGLGRHADGIVDALILGPSMRDLINRGYLTDYRIFAPPSNLDLSSVTIGASGDYSNSKLRDATSKSTITGDIVDHYLKIAPGKLGVTFTVSIEEAARIAQAFKASGVPAECISSKTPDLLRAHIMRRFRNREVLQLVNVDLLGEGVDVPAIEVVSFGRATASYATYSQQLGRSLRPMPGKTHAIIIDHVGNVLRHGLPDSPRLWSLDARDRKARTTPLDVIPLKTCDNCFAVYSRYLRVCPHCGHYTIPKQRSTPEQVDGDLTELSQDTLAALRGEINRIDSVPRIPQGLSGPAQLAIANRHKERFLMQKELRENIALWAGKHKQNGLDDSEIYRRFYFNFGIDVLTAQTLNANDSKKLIDNIVNSM